MVEVTTRDPGPRSVQIYARVTELEFSELTERYQREGFPSMSAMIRHALGISEVDYRTR